MLFGNSVKRLYNDYQYKEEYMGIEQKGAGEEMGNCGLSSTLKKVSKKSNFSSIYFKKKC